MTLTDRICRLATLPGRTLARALRMLAACVGAQ